MFEQYERETTVNIQHICGHTAQHTLHRDPAFQQLC
jgi:hypothetical protein